MDPTSIPNSLSLSLFFQQNLWPILEKICMEQVQFCLVQWLAVSTRGLKGRGFMSSYQLFQSLQLSNVQKNNWVEEISLNCLKDAQTTSRNWTKIHDELYLCNLTVYFFNALYHQLKLFIQEWYFSKMYFSNLPYVSFLFKMCSFAISSAC